MTHRNSPSEVTVRRLLEIFQQTGSVNDVKTEIRVRFSRFTGKVVAVRPNVEENPTTLIWHRAQEINFPEKLFYLVGSLKLLRIKSCYPESFFIV